MMMNFFGFIMFYSGLVCFSFKRKHLLLMLLSLEYLVISLYVLMFNYLTFLESECFFSMVFITFSVCEGVVGLSVLVSLVRTHGNDYFQSFSVLW